MNECSVCKKRKCEVKDFLAEFIRSEFDTKIFDSEFECCDKTGEGPKKVEAIITINGERYAIEAKTLEIERVSTMSAMESKLRERIEHVLASNSNNEICNLFITVVEQFGLCIEFNEGILLLDKIFYDRFDSEAMKDNTVTSDDLVIHILFKILEKFDVMIRENTCVGIAEVNLEELSSRLSPYRKIGSLKKVIREQRELTNQVLIAMNENSKNIGNDEHASYSRFLDSIIQNEKQLNIRITPSKKVGELEMGVYYHEINYRDHANIKRYYGKLINDTHLKFKNYDADIRKILFLNSNSIAVTEPQFNFINDISDVLKEEEYYASIDEIWVEYYPAEIVNNGFDSIECEVSSKKEYLRLK